MLKSPDGSIFKQAWQSVCVCVVQYMQQPLRRCLPFNKAKNSIHYHKHEEYTQTWAAARQSCGRAWNWTVFFFLGAKSFKLIQAILIFSPVKIKFNKSFPSSYFFSPCIYKKHNCLWSIITGHNIKYTSGSILKRTACLGVFYSHSWRLCLVLPKPFGITQAAEHCSLVCLWFGRVEKMSRLWWNYSIYLCIYWSHGYVKGMF